MLAFEQAIQQKALRGPLSEAEQFVLAVEALEREVNNGGYSQFFVNPSNDFVGVIESALVAVGCPKTAQITHDAIAALNIEGETMSSKAEAAILADNSAVLETLSRCDDRYFLNDEAIAEGSSPGSSRTPKRFGSQMPEGRDQRFCPLCGEEYAWDVEECPACDIDTVGRSPGPDPTPDAELVCAFATGDAGVIGLAKSLLEAEPIDYFVRGDGLQDLFGLGRITGFSYAVGPAEFWVRASDADRARELLEGLIVEDSTSAQSDDL